MKVGILVDATCDIPTSILSRHNVTILPTMLNLRSEAYPDARRVDDTLSFYNEQPEYEINDASYHSAGFEELKTLLEDKLLYTCDHLVFIAPHIKLSSTLKNIREALFDLQPALQQLREQARITTPFKVRIIESEQAYAGYGLVLYEALRLLNEKARSADQIKAPLIDFRRIVETYIFPGQMNGSQQHLAVAPFNQSWLKLKKHKLMHSQPIFKIDQDGFRHMTNIRSTTLENSFLEFVYDYLTRTSLHNHLVNISYAGKLSQLRVSPTFKQLHEHVKAKRGRLVYSNMSPSSATQLGLGALSVSFSGGKL
jgi:fatty acid-binding protein DegV